MKSLLAAIVFSAVLAPAWAKEVVIDVRTPQEYAEGHIAGAINIDHSMIARDISTAGVSKDDTVLLYCRSGRRSGLALESLKSLGYSKAQNIGGIDAARKTLQKP